MSGVRVALWGFGHMNKIILTYLKEKGHTLVAVVGHHDAGKDAGEVAGAGPIGVKITHSDEGAKVIAETKPVVCILATRSFLKDLAQPMKMLAEN